MEELENEQLLDNPSVDCLNALLVSYELLEILEKIKHTTLFTQRLKNCINHLIPELEKTTDNMKHVWGTDDETLYQLLQDKADLSRKIAKYRPEDKSGLNAVLTKYYLSPKEFLEHNDIFIIEGSNPTQH